MSVLDTITTKDPRWQGAPWYARHKAQRAWDRENRPVEKPYPPRVERKKPRDLSAYDGHPWTDEEKRAASSANTRHKNGNGPELTDAQHAAFRAYKRDAHHRARNLKETTA